MPDPQDRIRRFLALQGAVQALVDASEGPVAVVFRHSIRGPIPLDPERRDVPLKPEGEALSRELGSRCELEPNRTVTSPMLRCRATAEHLFSAMPTSPRAGRERVREATPTRMLGAPGAFVRDADLAWQDYVAWKKQELVRKLFVAPEQLRGYYPQAVGVQRLADELLPERADKGAGLTFAFSHDILMSATLSWLAERPWQDSDWPDFHEGFALWRARGQLCAWYRGEVFRRAVA